MCLTECTVAAGDAFLLTGAQLAGTDQSPGRAGAANCALDFIAVAAVSGANGFDRFCGNFINPADDANPAVTAPVCSKMNRAL